jgi:dTDP-4-amino-4,6-dideoxygalactose transaminase
MDTIMALASKHGLLVVEDAAQALGATYKGRALGTIGHLGALSFHETKNVVSGEGGALLINDSRFHLRAEIIREKGTNRSQFFRGQVDKYTWVDIGSSYLPSELIAAVLLAQLEVSHEITSERMTVWQAYHDGFKDLEAKGFVRRPVTPEHRQMNAHIYFLITKSLDERTKLLKHLKDSGISSVFHYVPLHSSPAGRKFGRTHGDLSLTTDLADRMLRLPLWAGFKDWNRVIDCVHGFYRA